jgi:hypothetical protein
VRKNPRRLASGDRYRVGPLDFRVPHDEAEYSKVAGMLSPIFDWTYFGFITSMLPNTFLNLAADGDLETDRPMFRDTHYQPNDTRLSSMRRGIQEGIEFAPPYLKFKELNGKWFTSAHEGRHRMLLIKKADPYQYVPVVIEIRANGRETRARDITDESIQALNEGAYREAGRRQGFVRGPLFGPLAIVDGRDVRTLSLLLQPIDK